MYMSHSPINPLFNTLKLKLNTFFTLASLFLISSIAARIKHLL